MTNSISPDDQLIGFADGTRQSKNSMSGENDPPEPAVNSLLQSAMDFLRGLVSSFNIGHLLLLDLGLHLFAMSFPSGKSDFVFDESYYVPAASDLLKLIPSNLEHPFFGKVFGAVGIYLFGNDFFGWRIFYVLIGVLSVWAVYELALVFFPKEKALFAASMLAFETLFFIHTSLALLEGPPIFFALLGFLAYFKRHYYWCALAFALSILSKEWGLFFLWAFLLYHVWATKHLSFSELFSRQRLKSLLVFIFILVLVVSLPLLAYDQVYHPYTSTSYVTAPVVIINPSNNSTITTTSTSTSYGYLTNPIQNFEYYFSYHTSLKVSQSDLQNDPWVYKPWLWILPFHINPQDYYVTTVTITTTAPNGTILSTTYLHPIDWLGIGNLVIWYSIWIIVPVLLIKGIRRKVTPLDGFIGSWIVGSYVPILLAYFVFHRVEYPFYFINLDPGLALGIPMVIAFISPDSSKLQKILMCMWLAAAVVFFVLYFPVHPLDFR